MVSRRAHAALKTLAAGVTVACVFAACGSRGDPVAHSAATTPHKPRFVTSAASRPPVRADAHTSAVVTRLLIAVFVHPQSAQCTTAMTPRYVSQAFDADAARSGISVMAECRVHQRSRAELPLSERRVTVPDIVLTGGEAHATVRGANGYPIGVTLSPHGATWRLDGFGVAAVASGQGLEVAPSGSLYAYRVPPGFVTGGTSIGAVQTTGAAFSTSVVLPGGPQRVGVAVGQTALGFGVHDTAALRVATLRLDRVVRGSPVARVFGPPVAGKIGRRLSLSWDLRGAEPDPAHTDGRTVLVFSSAKNVVIVNCRWPHTGPDRLVLRTGCEAVLATLAVG
jgi:hypothetical protein